MALPKRNWRDMSEAEIGAADTTDWIAVLPLGAHEQHGPHLPFETDTIIAQGVSHRLAAQLDDDLKVTFLLTEETGYSPEHMDYKGSRSLSWNDAIQRWISFGEMLHGYGVKKLMLLNAHGGNSPLMTIVATELRVRFDMLCVATSWTRHGDPVSHVGEYEKAFGIHGGDIETSVMLALAPDKVAMEKAENFRSFQEDLAVRNEHLRAYGPHAFGWKMQDLNQQGVVGTAMAATAEKGEDLLAEAVFGLSELLEEMDRFDLSHFDRKPIVSS